MNTKETNLILTSVSVIFIRISNSSIDKIGKISSEAKHKRHNLEKSPMVIEFAIIFYFGLGQQ